MLRRLLPDLGQRTHVMGILNVTPDSFSDGGRFAAIEDALRQSAALAEEGADLLDIGGESTRPGATPVPEDEEIARVVPVIRSLTADGYRLPLSIDTYKAATAAAALAAGAAIVNDVWGLQRDPDIARVAADHDAPVIIMHNRPAVDPAVDIVADMLAWFDRSLAIARKAGISDADIMLDPGIGFGKTLEQNLAAIARLPEIRSLGFPILMGTSRKSMIGLLNRERTDPRDRLAGTIASNVAAILAGADMLRVHDVAAHVDAGRVADAIARARR